MEKFPHLNLIQKLKGNAQLNGFGPGKSQKTKDNEVNREQHSYKLKDSANKIETEWGKILSERAQQGLPKLDENVIPIFLQIDTNVFKIEDSFWSYNIEVISEEDDGYVIGASYDKLEGLKKKIEDFANRHGKSKNQAAQLWQIIDGKRWKLEHILSDELLSKWDLIEPNGEYIVDVGIAISKKTIYEPKKGIRNYESKKAEFIKSLQERDDFIYTRQEHFEEFIAAYNGVNISGFYDNEDSFSCRINISGKGLIDLVLNYQYIFEVAEPENIESIDTKSDESQNITLEIIQPTPESPLIGIIDSGIQEKHNLLEKAIDAEKSKSYLPDDTSTADYVSGGGHGTRVAGAVLFPRGITGLGKYQLPCFIRNLRILDKNNILVNKLYPPTLMKLIVDDNDDCKIFNLSINSKVPFRQKHISQWANTIDQLIHEQNVLFITSAGNLSENIINGFLSSNIEYPSYLENDACRIANPGHSCFSLTVGSINHTKFENADIVSLGIKDEISPFSRIGLGIWDMIKPDVVEYGGGLVQIKTNPKKASENPNVTTELIRSTLSGGYGVGKDAVGTSFATPKVTHIAAQLLKIYKDEPVNLIRALIVHSARLPGKSFNNPKIIDIKHLGYGFPSLQRALSNNPHRITFYTTDNIGNKSAHLYSIKIPESFQSPGDEYDYLIEVTLAYTARTRRTRKRTKSYLSTWLSWEASKKDDDLEIFKIRAIKENDGNLPQSDGWNWKIADNTIHGEVKGVNRTNSSLQKDWTIIQSFDLPKELCFAIKAHDGWEKNEEEVPYAFVVSIEILGANVEIYDLIRIENEIEIENEI